MPSRNNPGLQHPASWDQRHVAAVIKPCDVPDCVSVLKHVDTAGVLPNPPDLIQIEAEEHASRDLIHDLMASQDDRLARVSRQEFLEKGLQPIPDIGQRLTVREAHLCRS